MREKDKIKALIGVCPQENVLFEELSAEENLRFVAHMHGMDRNAITSRTRRAFATNEHRRAQGCGQEFFRWDETPVVLGDQTSFTGPQILFLDEPTAGLDPQARRLVWDFIRDLKNTGMTIILTTHDMVKPDILSDHVAIIDHGKIIAYGTPEELKSTSDNGNVLELGFFSHEDLAIARDYLQALPTVSKVTELPPAKLVISFSGGISTLKTEILGCSHAIKTFQFREDTLEDISSN